MNNLLKTSLILKKSVDKYLQMYLNNEPPTSMKDRAFFESMKSETRETHDLLAEWEEGALDFIKQNRSRIHPHQIVSTKENYELFLLHSYYIDEREKRYMELKYSIRYVLTILIEDIENLKTR